jgi:divalent metal cation (Fe/Co/Zn/Cd) transporter
MTSVRSRSDGVRAAIDLTITVHAELTTAESHNIADRVEHALEGAFAGADVTVHIEPEPPPTLTDRPRPA